MRYVDKTVVGLTIAFLILLALNFVLAEWMRFIGLQSLARGAVALGLLVLWRSGLVSFGHALYFGFGAYTAVMLSLTGFTDAFLLVFAVGATGIVIFGHDEIQGRVSQSGLVFGSDHRTSSQEPYTVSVDDTKINK